MVVPVVTMTATNRKQEGLMTNVYCIEVKDFRLSIVVDNIWRCPKQMAGWKKVRYLNQDYQLFGGIRNNYFIDLSNPIRQNKDS